MSGCVYLLLPVLLPMLAGIAVNVKKLNRSQKARLSVGAVAVSAAVSLLGLLFGEGTRLTVWHITGAIEVAFRLDKLSMFYVAFVSLVWAGVALYAGEYLEHDEHSPRFWSFFLVSYGALMGLSMSENLITLYMFYECMTLVTVPLVAHNMDREAVAAAVKYLIYSVFGASMALIGIFFIGAYADTFTFRAGGILSAELVGGHESLLRVIFFLMIMGFGVKAGMFPMHSWLPTAHPVAPAPASAVLSGVITKMGVLGILRTIFYVAGAEFLRGTWVQYTFMILTLITVVMGSMLAFREKGFKKRLAYSTVSQVSYVLFGVSTLTTTGLVGALLHILFHSLIKNTLFMSAGAVIHKTGKTNVEELDGIGKQMPLTMTLFTVVSLGLIGIPPTGGFISKWNLASAALSMNLKWNWVGPAMLLFSAILTAGYLLSVTIHGFFPGERGVQLSKNEVSWRMLAPMGVMATLTVILGAFPAGLIQFFTAIAQTIL